MKPTSALIVLVLLAVSGTASANPRLHAQHAVALQRGVDADATGSGRAPAIRSLAALVLDQKTGATMFGKNVDAVRPIEST